MAGQELQQGGREAATAIAIAVNEISYRVPCLRSDAKALRRGFIDGNDG